MSCMVIVYNIHLTILFFIFENSQSERTNIFQYMRREKQKKNGETFFMTNRMKKEAVAAFHLMADESEFSIHSKQHVVRQ